MPGRRFSRASSSFTSDCGTFAVELEKNSRDARGLGFQSALSTDRTVSRSEAGMLSPLGGSRSPGGDHADGVLVAFALASRMRSEHPQQRAEVLAEARPDELFASFGRNQFTWKTSAGSSRECAHLHPVAEVIRHVVTAERQRMPWDRAARRRPSVAPRWSSSPCGRGGEDALFQSLVSEHERCEARAAAAEDRSPRWARPSGPSNFGLMLGHWVTRARYGSAEFGCGFCPSPSRARPPVDHARGRDLSMPFPPRHAVAVHRHVREDRG